ncbi:MAG: hypothetical protein ACPG5Y_06145, partial [Pseudomonadales bacterium]
QDNSINQSLTQRGVTSLMDDQIAHHADHDMTEVNKSIKQGKDWLLVYKENEITAVIASQDLAQDQLQDSIQQARSAAASEFGFCSSRATLREAWDLSQNHDYAYLLITDLDEQVIGVLPTNKITNLMQQG